MKWRCWPSILLVAVLAGCQTAGQAAPAAKPASTDATGLPAGAAQAAQAAQAEPGGNGAAATAPLTGAADTQHFVVAQASGPSVAVFDQPGAAAPARTLHQPTPAGGPLVFLVTEARPDGWLRVDLPVRPNGSSGWVEATAVTLAASPYRVEVRLAEHVLTVLEGEVVVLREPIGVGQEPNPTPGGRFYLYELLRPPDPQGPYGPYAFGLSGFSDTLTSFAGGDGRLGIHGTDDDSSIGRDATHGCIRLANPAIVQLAETVPLGTPVLILS